MEEREVGSVVAMVEVLEAPPAKAEAEMVKAGEVAVEQVAKLENSVRKVENSAAVEVILEVVATAEVATVLDLSEGGAGSDQSAG